MSPIRITPFPLALLVAGLLLGTLDAVLCEEFSFGAWVVSTGMWGLPALLLAGLSVGFLLLLRVALKRSPSQRLHELLTTDVGPERLWPGGALLAGAGLIATGPYAGALVHYLLERVTVAPLGRVLAGVGTLGLLGFMALVWLGLSELVRRLIWRRLKVAVPLLHLLSWLLILPVMGWGLFLYIKHGESFGPAAANLGFLTLVMCALVLWSPAAALPRKLRILVGAVLIAPLAAPIGWATFSYPEDGGAAAARLALPGRMLELCRGLTDFDGDGHSGLLGGADCDPWDGDIHPGATEVPDNDIDEDCDGRDLDSAARAELAFGDATPRVIEGAKRFNVAVILIDAVRADHAHFLGYKRRTTPQLDRLAEESLVFARTYSGSSCTRKAIPSLFAGRFPQYMDWDTKLYFYGLNPGNLMMAEFFRDNGYQTAAIVNAWLYEKIWGFKQGFEHWESIYEAKDWKKYSNKSSPIAIMRSIQWLEHRDPDKPFFLFTYLEDPHYPYKNHPHPASRFGKKKLDRYDAEISYADAWTGVLFEYLKQADLWDDTIVVVFSDHGEEFKEHGKTHHCQQLYLESVHVILQVKIPGVAPAMVEVPVSLIDVFPTLLDATGLDLDRSLLQGVSLLAAAEQDPDNAPDRPLFNYVRLQKKKTDRSHGLLLGDWHLIRNALTGKEELYNLSKDPGEKNDLIEAEPNVLPKLRRMLSTFLEDANLN